MALWGMNIKTMPLSIQANGGKFLTPDGAHETYDTQSVMYQFNDFIFTWENNTIESGPYGKNYGLAFIGANGTLVANRDDWQVYPDRDKVPAKTVKADYEDHKDHATNFLNSMKKKDRNTACPIDNGSLCAKYAHLGNIAARLSGKSLQYDDNKKSFNIEEANKYIKPTYREPWIFPVI